MRFQITTKIAQESPREIAFGPHGSLCRSAALKFSNDANVKSPESTQRPDLPAVELIPSARYRIASGIDNTALQEPYYLSARHFEVYLPIRQVEPCKLDDFRRTYPTTRGKEKQRDRHGSALRKTASPNAAAF